MEIRKIKNPSLVMLWMMLHQVLSSTVTMPGFSRSLPTTFPRDTEIVNLEPILLDFFPAQKNKMYLYHAKLTSFTYKIGNSKHIPVELGENSNLMECNIIPNPGITGYLCVDQQKKRINTTKEFNPDNSSNYKFTLTMKLVDTNGIDAFPFNLFIVNINIKPFCDAFEDTSRSVKECSNVKEIGMISFTTNHGLIFRMDVKQKNKPIMITKIKLPGFKKTTKFLHVSIFKDDNLVLDSEINEIPDNFEIKINLYERYAGEDYTIRFRDNRGIFMSMPMKTKIYVSNMDEFCQQIQCYSEYSYFETLKKLPGSATCTSNDFTIKELFKRCENISLPIIPTITQDKINYKLGETFKLKCSTNNLFVPHTIGIQQLTDANQYEVASFGSSFEGSTSISKDRLNFYQCIVTTYTGQTSVYASENYLLNIQDVFKTKISYTVNIPFDTYSFQNLEIVLKKDIRKIAEKSYPNLKQEDWSFALINFKKDKNGMTITLGSLIMHKKTDKLIKTKYDKWLDDWKKAIVTESPNNRKASSPRILSFIMCAKQTKGGYNWDALDIGVTGHQPCIGDNNNNATVTCELDNFSGQLTDVDTSKCSLTINITLDDISKIAVTDENVEQVSGNLKEATERASKFTTYDLFLSVASLKNIIGHMTVSKITEDNVFAALDNVLNVPERIMQASQVANSTSLKILDLLGLAGERISSNPPSIKSRKNYALGGAVVTGPSYIKTNAQINTKNVTMNITLPMSSIPEERIVQKGASMTVPPLAFKNILLEGGIKFVAIAYRNSKLFQQEGSLKINGNLVLSGEIRGHPIENLDDNIEMNFKPKKKYKRKTLNKICAFWKPLKRVWSNQGMTTILDDYDTNGIVKCQSNHLTNFAVLFNAQKPKNEIHEEILTVITYLGLGVSMAGALLTLMTYLIFPMLREKTPPKIQMNLCVALLLLSVVFLIGVERKSKSEEACQTIGFLTQYFLLSVFSWNAIEGSHSTRVLVFPLKGEINMIMTKALVVGWGFPLVLTGIGFSVWSEDYANDESCFAQSMAFYITTIIPIGLVLAINSCTLTWIVYRIHYRKNKYVSHESDLMHRIRMIVGLSILLGICWIFAVPMMLVRNEVAFQYIFCIFSSVQGLYIFLFYCVRNDKARLYWKLLLGGKTVSEIRRHIILSSLQTSRNKSDAGADVTHSKM